MIRDKSNEIAEGRWESWRVLQFYVTVDRNTVWSWGLCLDEVLVNATSRMSNNAKPMEPDNISQLSDPIVSLVDFGLDHIVISMGDSIIPAAVVRRHSAELGIRLVAGIDV